MMNKKRKVKIMEMRMKTTVVVKTIMKRMKCPQLKAQNPPRMRKRN